MKVIREGAFYVLDNGQVSIDGWQIDPEGKAIDFASLLSLAMRSAAQRKLRSAACALAEAAALLPDAGDEVDVLLDQARGAVSLIAKRIGGAG